MYVWTCLETFLVIANGVGGDATDTKLAEAQAAADSHIHRTDAGAETYPASVSVGTHEDSILE